MFSVAKVTEIYGMVDDFCMEFAEVQEKLIVEDRYVLLNTGNLLSLELYRTYATLRRYSKLLGYPCQVLASLWAYSSILNAVYLLPPPH